MKIQLRQNASTGTSYSKQTPNYYQDDETYVYTEITEYLISQKPKFRILSTSNLEISSLPLRRSLFAHVPPFITFQRKEASQQLPPEITRHLFWLVSKNSLELIFSVVKKSGFSPTKKLNSNWCGTWWKETLVQHTKPFSKVNHFPSGSHFGNKIQLWKRIKKMQRKHGFKNFDFMPLSFVLPKELDSLRQYTRQNGGCWILKPPNSCAGEGISIISDLKKIPKKPLICQFYISIPKLINGVKFDIRLYVLVTSIDPLRIYLYENGLVRFATVKYLNNPTTFQNRFMHLTNTSVNKNSPNFIKNVNLNENKGSMWSMTYLWKYLGSECDVDTVWIWDRIKEIAVKTVISMESILVKNLKNWNSYNFYQLLGFDVILDGEFRPWLLEVNVFPSMETDTTLCGIVKGQLVEDFLNLVGYHVPDLLSEEELRVLNGIYEEKNICFQGQIYSWGLTWEDGKKQYKFRKMAIRELYLKEILKRLTPADAKVLIRHEDELTRTGRFEIIFPTKDSFRYFEFFEEVRYYNLLLDAWENEYGEERKRGIERLKKLCKRKYHLP
ncbi:tubulin polyglutamylase TTLL4-like [Colletes gigas]|uniref:tubulin polyglutamylase TTLL4-like n=1 Tax=Colletes gigas TaxID=935657 RepID=UPI001C9B2DE0|nr:tubulin polyglutamylase TTLL4-like [Colletes gigas]